ncbi:hypothetical protein I549_1683 [Mycobacterium avium subsp. avium 2285 (R)]|nr:hypothetical protein I549_1683 [Mycobacterium avium subsp. avium 2285 (R)]
MRRRRGPGAVDDGVAGRARVDVDQAVAFALAHGLRLDGGDG